MSEKTDLERELEEQHAIEAEFDNQMSLLDSATSLEASVLDTGKIDRVTMESLSRLDPGAISPHYPLATYTQEPSQQNYDVALESFDVVKAVAIAAAGGLLGAILMYIIKLFRSDNVDTRIDYLEKARDSIKENEKAFIKTLRDTEKKYELTPEQKAVFDRIEKYDLSLIVSNPPKASREAEAFIKALGRSGDIYKILERWSHDIVQYTSEFRKRVRILTECIDQMYEVKGAEIQKLVKKVKDVEVDGNTPFIKDMGAAQLLWEKLNVDENYVDFIKSSVVGTDAFYTLVADERTLLDYDKLYSASEKQLEKNLKEIEKYAETLSGSKREEAKVKAQRAAKTRTNGDTVTIDAGGGAINPMIIMAIRSAEDSVRNESTALSNYRKLLGQVLYFYQHAAGAREKLDNGFLRRLMEVQNSGQPK